jgi:hypothetical protein
MHYFFVQNKMNTNLVFGIKIPYFYVMKNYFNHEQRTNRIFNTD